MNSKYLMDLNTAERFTMDDFPGMVLVAWAVVTDKGMTRVMYKVDNGQKQRFDSFTKPSLSTVYPA